MNITVVFCLIWMIEPDKLAASALLINRACIPGMACR